MRILLNQRRPIRILLAGFVGLATPLMSSGVCGQAEDDAPAADAAEIRYEAATANDAAIELSELALLLLPLTKDELQVEADAWLQLLKEKTTEISQTEINARRARAEANQAKDAAEPVVDSASETQDQDSSVAEAADAETGAATESIVRLRSEQTAIMERLKTVLAAFENKGGDASSYKTYIDAVAGLKNSTNDLQSVVAYVNGWLRSPDGGIQLLRQLGIALVTLLVAWILAGFAGRAAGHAVGMHQGVSALLKDFTSKFAGRLVLLIGAIMALASLGVEVGPMLAALGAGGFILAFALQESIGNFAAGLMIMLNRPFDTGHFVDIDGVNGTVQRVSLASTQLLTPDNKLVIVPNSKVLGGVITNANGSSTRRIDFVFGIGYGDDIGQAIDILEGLVREHPKVLESPEPTIKVSELADSSVNLICRPWVVASDYWSVYWDLTRSVKERFDAQGISIPFPQRDVHVHSADTQQPLS